MEKSILFDCKGSYLGVYLHPSVNAGMRIQLHAAQNRLQQETPLRCRRFQKFFSCTSKEGQIALQNQRCSYRIHGVLPFFPMIVAPI